MLHIGEKNQIYDRGHMFHTDGCSVTMNLCLGENFQGGDLLLSTERCKIDENKKYKCEKAYPDLTEENYHQIEQKRALEIISNEMIMRGSKKKNVIDNKLLTIVKRNYYRYVQKPYTVIIHRGEQPHLSTSTLIGTRMNLVLFINTNFKFYFFENLSKDIKLFVLSFLDERSISNFRLASKSCKSLSESDSLWKIKYEQFFGKIPTPHNENISFPTRKIEIPIEGYMVPYQQQENFQPPQQQEFIQQPPQQMFFDFSMFEESGIV
jgi:hypothetical protein